MATLITKCYPSNPLRATSMSEGGLNYYTYGAYLMDSDYNNTDPALRRLIMLCMAHHPAHRMSLEFLHATVEYNCYKEFGNLDDDTLRKWVHEIFQEPVALRTSGEGFRY
jgi:hypothetical protein